MSLYFQGNLDSYLSLANVDGLDFRDVDFTVEYWMYITYNNPYPRVFQIGNHDTTTTIGVSVELEPGNTYLWHQNENNNGYDGTYIGDSSFNEWIHYAICRSSGTTTIYKNGVSIDSFSDLADYASNDNLIIGNETVRTDDSAFTGYLVGFSWSKGISRYNGNFTPPLQNPPVDDYTQFVLGGLAGYEIYGPLANSIVNTNVLLRQTNLPAGYTFVPIEQPPGPVVPVYTFEEPLRRLCCQRLVFGVDEKKTEKKGYTRTLTSNYSTLGRRRR